MNSGDIYVFTISNKINGKPLIKKEYVYLSKFDAKIQSSILFLSSAGINVDKEQLKTKLDYFTEDSNLIKYLNKFVVVKDYYGDKTRIYNLKKK